MEAVKIGFWGPVLSLFVSHNIYHHFDGIRVDRLGDDQQSIYI